VDQPSDYSQQKITTTMILICQQETSKFKEKHSLAWSRR